MSENPFYLFFLFLGLYLIEKAKKRRVKKLHYRCDLCIHKKECRILIALILIPLFFFSCSSPGSPLGEMAVIEVEIEHNPATISYSEIYEMWTFQNCLIFYEKCGVSGEIEAITFEVTGYGDTLFKTVYGERKFRNFESWKLCFDLAHKEVMKALRIEILGRDSRGRRIDSTKVFFLTK
jgi:hypothetical protein